MGFELPNSIQTALAQGKTILTANQRVAQTLRRAFDQAQQTSSWTPPRIFALDAFLVELWQQMLVQGSESRLLLNPLQEHTVWRNIIATDREVSALRSADALAELAASAWRLLCLHNGRHRLRECNISLDTRAFLRWAEAFDRTCTRNAWLPSAQLPAALAAALAEGNLPVSDPGLILVDFDSLPPAHFDLFDSIRQAGYPVDTFKIAAPNESAILHTAMDDRTEMRAAGRWAKQQLERDPDTSIAIVVPNLAERRSQLDRVLSAILTPAHFEFSLGRPLIETPVAATALDLLRWSLEPLPVESISALLLSHFFAATDTEAALAAAEFDAFELRRLTLLRSELSLEATLTLVRRSPRLSYLTSLYRSLQSMQRIATTELTASSQSHAVWADAFRNLLEASGHTGRAIAADSLSFQTHRRWESALDQLATLDFDGTRLTASDAFDILTRITRKSIFAPKSRNAPVQILGPLEPGGVAFDALWFLSADDRTWPTPASRNPLLPRQLKRDLGIPGADPASDAAFAQRLTHRLSNVAPLTFFSFALHVQSEEGLRRPSPLLRALDLSLSSTLPAEVPHRARPLIPYQDHESIPPLPSGPLRGGARVLELQSACAFRAFAEIRLRSTEPGTRTPGLDAMDRGNHVHKIMQYLWSNLQSQAELRALLPEGRRSLLDNCIERALTIPAATSWDLAYLDVQRRRLRTLMLPWLEIELARPPFTVRQQEKKQLVRIGPLELELRADRIDDTPFGPVILDYKTGEASPSEWLSDRPDAPQLPLYAVLAQSATGEPESIAGIAFALLRSGNKIAFQGFADNAVLLQKHGKMPFATLAEQLEDWHRVLSDLAHAFAEDYPITAPKSFPQTCKSCSQRILCRLDLTTLESASEDEEVESFA